MSPKEFFQSEKEKSAKQADVHASNVTSLAGVRIAIFVTFLVLLVVFANARMVLGVVILLGVFPFIFGLVVQRFNRQQRLKKLFTDISKLHSEELDRLAHRLDGLDGGDEFVDRTHSYSYDLDLFGNHSLFSLLNRASTPDGRQRLADWMLNVPRIAEIRQRQQAIAELKQDPAWMISFLAKGKQELDAPVEELRAWLKEDNLPRKKSLSWIAPSLTVLFAGMVYMVIYQGWPFFSLILPLLVNGLILRTLQSPLHELSKRISGNVKILRSYENMVQMFYARSFDSERLKTLHEPFTASSVGSIQSLRKLLDFLDGRSNMFYGMMDLFFLLDVYLYEALAKWKSQNKADLSQWFENIAEVEALGGMALHAYANSNAVFPEFSDDLQWKGTQLGHPLIPADERVTNDFEMGSGISIITGSNMSGKSTFLRTVGLNSVMAFLGSTVCADDMRLSRMQIYTAMRTEDDLKSHISSFYAELKRIRGLLQVIDELPTLCLLDEILKGTNTEDRHRGAMGLLEQLSKHNVLGIVSTHDLALGRWGDEKGFPNFSFNSTIEGNTISFDYRISEGVCRSFNASQLMRNMGIELPPSE